MAKEFDIKSFALEERMMLDMKVWQKVKQYKKMMFLKNLRLDIV